MPISNYSELKTAVANWMARGDVAGEAGDFISLGEAGLNRELPAVETDVSLTGTVGSRRIDVSATSMVEPIALFLSDPDTSDEIRLTMKADGSFAYIDTAGEPRFWAIDGENIDFDRPLDQAYTFRFRMRQRFSLSDAQPTNWLLTNHPDVYLAACIVWGGVFLQDDQTATRWAVLLKQGVPSVKNIIAQKKRGTLTVDPALQDVGRRSVYDGGRA